MDTIVPETEFYNRFKLAYQLANPPASHYPLTAEDMERVKINREMAAKMAERGFEFRFFNTVEEIRIAAQALLNQSVANGELEPSSCGKFVPCSVNSIIVAMTDMGRLPSEVSSQSIFRLSPCFNEECPKSDAIRPVELASHADACDDTITFGRVR